MCKRQHGIPYSLFKKKEQHTEKAQAHNQHAYTVSQTHPYALTTLELLPYLAETKKKDDFTKTLQG